MHGPQKKLHASPTPGPTFSNERMISKGESVILHDAEESLHAEACNL